jgi:hypothetical protein
MDLSEFTLGDDQKAEAVYRQLQTGRQAVIDMGRLMAELTIPAVFPPDGYTTGDDLPGNNQSLSAMCVNTLASNIMFMAFPPGQPICRFKVEETKLQKDIESQPELYSKTILGLSRLEISHRERLQATPIATAYNNYIKLLLICGNALWKHIKLNEPMYRRPDSYVVQRSEGGSPLLTILEDCRKLQALSKKHREQIIKLAPKDFFANKKEWEKEVKIYSVCKLKVGDTDSDDDKSWLYWEEWEGHILEDTAVETDFDVPPMHPGQLIPVPGQNWARGYCEEYRGDLFVVEQHASAINDGASAAALSLIFVKPGQTSLKAVREARNLSVLPGRAEDVTMFRTEKTADYNFVVNNLEVAARRLGAAFMLQSSIQRSGERVTREEIVRLGTELDKALGGLNTQIAQYNQRPIIVRAIRLHEAEDKTIPPIPEDIVSIQVITGVDALGASLEADTLQQYAVDGKAAFPETFEKIHDGRDYFRRMAAARGIKPDGLVKSEEVSAQEDQAAQQMAMQQQLIEKGTGPAVKGVADYLSNQQQGGAPQAMPEAQ